MPGYTHQIVRVQGILKPDTLLRPDVEILSVKKQALLTFVSVVESSEGDHKEGGGVFPSIHQVGEGSLGVTVTAQALHEAEPGWQALDHGSQAVRIAVTHRAV